MCPRASVTKLPDAKPLKFISDKKIPSNYKVQEEIFTLSAH